MSNPPQIVSGPVPNRGDISKTPRPVASRAGAAVCLAVIFLSAGSVAFFYYCGLSNLYGDGIAHVEGARRIFDSLTPGYAEIGSVWLPLFHLLAAPLARNDFLWRSGLAGSLVSSLAFVLTAWLIFRLGLEMNRTLSGGVIATAGFVLCPNMLYLASTPLTEPLAQLWLVVVVYCLYRFQQGGRRVFLVGAGLACFLGTLTRYDAWYLLPFSCLFLLVARKVRWRERIRDAAIFSGLAGLGPALWVAHNAFRFGNPLEFYNGPYSAQAIYAHQLATTGFRYPTEGSLWLAARYYLADLLLVIGVWSVGLGVLGLIVWVVEREERGRRLAALLLLVPLPFYLHSLAYAAVPLYVPTLFPNTYYNLRYGMALLPSVAVLPSFLLGARLPEKGRMGLAGIMVALLIIQGVSMVAKGVRELPLIREAILNTPCNQKRQQTVIEFLRGRYDGGTVLAAAGKWPCVMPAVGIPFRKTLSDVNRTYWKTLRYEPERFVEWIIRGEGDPVDELMRAYPEAFRGFELLKEGTFRAEGRVAIYRRREPGQAPAATGQKSSW